MVDHLTPSTSAPPPTHESETAPPTMSVSVRLRARRGLNQPPVHTSSLSPPPSLETAASTSAGKLQSFGEVNPEARIARRRARRLLKKAQAREQEEVKREQLDAARLEKKAAKRSTSKERRYKLAKATRPSADEGDTSPDGSLLVDNSVVASGDTSQLVGTTTPEGKPGNY
jgi:hypothetical protein